MALCDRLEASLDQSDATRRLSDGVPTDVNSIPEYVSIDR